MDTLSTLACHGNMKFVTEDQNKAHAMVCCSRAAGYIKGIYVYIMIALRSDNSTTHVSTASLALQALVTIQWHANL